MSHGGFYGTTPRSCRPIIPDDGTVEGESLESLLVKQHQLISSLIKENKALQSEVSSFSTQLKEVKEDLSSLKERIEYTKPVQEKKRLPKALTVSALYEDTISLWHIQCMHLVSSKEFTPRFGEPV